VIITSKHIVIKILKQPDFNHSVFEGNNHNILFEEHTGMLFNKIIDIQLTPHPTAYDVTASCKP
jgi:hypothetical protein